MNQLLLKLIIVAICLSYTIRVGSLPAARNFNDPRKVSPTNSAMDRKTEKVLSGVFGEKPDRSTSSIFSSGGPGKKTSRSHHTSSKRSSASKQQHHHQSSSNTHGGPASSSNIKSLHQSSSAKYGNSSSNSSHKLSSNGSSFGASNLNEGLPVKVQPSEPSVVCCQSPDSAKMAVSSLLTIMVS